MKENSFKFRESFGHAVLSMTDKQAGQLIKGLSGYAFEGKKLQSNDNTIKSSFSLIKNNLDADEQNKQNGRIGGLIAAEQKRKNGRKDDFTNAEQNNGRQLDFETMKELIELSLMVDDTIRLLSVIVENQENFIKNEGKVLQKTDNDKQDKENATKPHFRIKASGKPASCGRI